MKRYVFPLTVVALTMCQSALADGYVPYSRLMPSRMPNALVTSTGNTGTTSQPINGETLKAPATVNGDATGYEGYPFIDRCGSGCNSCCDGVWNGYNRHCFRFRKHGYGGCGGDTGCDSGCNGYSNGCGADACGCGGWGRGGCFGNSFAGGCGGCFGLGWGGFQHACMKLGLHGFKQGCGCDTGCSSGYSGGYSNGGCSSCNGNGGYGYSNGHGYTNGHSNGNGYSAPMNGGNMNTAPTPQLPTPAVEEAPAVAPATKSAFRPAMPRGYMPRITNW